jgi:hypothetical protein
MSLYNSFHRHLLTQQKRNKWKKMNFHVHVINHKFLFNATFCKLTNEISARKWKLNFNLECCVRVCVMYVACVKRRILQHDGAKKCLKWNYVKRGSLAAAFTYIFNFIAVLRTLQGFFKARDYHGRHFMIIINYWPLNV